MQKSALAKILPLGIIFFLAIFAGRGLLHVGFPPTHDGEYHIIRFYEFDRSLRQGYVYPRWAPDLNKGYGVPLFNYVYPLPNYVSSLLHTFGLSFIDAFKLGMLAALLLGALFMYLWARSFWGSAGGIVASVFYTYGPYHFLDIYIRGSVGEVWALGFFPAVLWSLTKLVREKKHRFLPLASLLLALVIFSHNIQALLFFPFVISYAAFLVYQKKQRRENMRNLLSVVFLGLGLSSIFWMPAIIERTYVRGLEVFDYRDHFVELYQLIFPSWGSGFSADQTSEGMSTQIGIANILVVLATLILMVVRKTYRRQRIIMFMCFWIFLSSFLMLNISRPLWNVTPFIEYLQFPWRFLSLVILCAAFLAGSIVYIFQSRALALFCILLSVVLGMGYSAPSYYHMRDDNYYITHPNFIDGTNSPGNAFNTIWFNENLAKATTLFEENEKSTRINIAYFPGWQVSVDGKRVKTEVDRDGLIRIEREPKDAKIEVSFGDTPIRDSGQIISLASFVVLFLLLLKSVRARMGRTS